MIFKPSIHGNYLQSIGKCLKFLRIESIGGKISEGSKIFPYLDELKHGERKLVGYRKERSWKLCVKPYKWKKSSNDNIIRPWLSLNVESSLEDCDLYFYDDVNGTLGKETGYQLPLAVVKNTIKLLERLRRDQNEGYVDQHSVDTCNLVGLGNDKRRSRKQNDGDICQRNARNVSDRKKNAQTFSNYYNIIKDHVEKIDEILETRPILEDLLDSLRNEGMDQTQSEA